MTLTMVGALSDFELELVLVEHRERGRGTARVYAPGTFGRVPPREIHEPVIDGMPVEVWTRAGIDVSLPCQPRVRRWGVVSRSPVAVYYEPIDPAPGAA